MSTVMVDLGPSDGLAINPDAQEIPFNLVTIHRHWDPLFQLWGNLCSRIVTKISNRSVDNKVIRWYHEKIFNFCYKQYDKYGDYYRLMDGAFATHEQDGIYEVI